MAVPGGSESIGSGLLSGMGSIVVGVAGGAAALVAAPILGAREAGVKGAAVGLAAGVVTAFALPLGGVVNGVGEVVAGAANTPSAIQAAAHLMSVSAKSAVSRGNEHSLRSSAALRCSSCDMPMFTR